MVDFAQSTFYGTVSATEGGFFYGRPGLMLTVSVSEWIKSGSDTPDVVHVFYPAGEFDLGPIRFCSTPPGWPEPPIVGSHVLLFPQSEPASANPPIYGLAGAGTEIVFEVSGILTAPDALHRIQLLHRPLDLDRLRKKVEELAGRAGERDSR